MERNRNLVNIYLLFPLNKTTKKANKRKRNKVSKNGQRIKNKELYI